IRSQFLRNIEERFAPDSLPHSLRDIRLVRLADLRLLAPHDSNSRGAGGFDQRDIALGVEAPLLEEVAHDGIGRASVRTDSDCLALEIAGPILVRGLESLGGGEIVVTAVDAVHHGAQLCALGLSEGIVLGPADEGESLA